MINKYKYPDGTIGPARQVNHNGQIYPASYLAQRAAETEAAWIARIDVLGVRPVRYEAWAGDPNTQDRGEAVETETDGWIVITYPNTTDKKPVYNKSTREVMYVAADQTVPDTYTALEPEYGVYSTWDADAAAWAYNTDRAAADVRSQRDTLLDECDWTQVADAPLTTEQVAEWTTYRQALRDIPQQEGFPAEVTWPVEPE
ncbi:tail fiber assembly protein [Pseudodesulfovibrio methanolicus]|uniref:Tail fiber assembly protein n=1 Tax=Pseudodesulfovibrio methanolicus TaxID=3126690 RepID=A0ABZ2J375_9BACT